MTTFDRCVVLLITFPVSVLSVSFAHSEDRLYVQSPAVYAPHADFIQSVKDECVVEIKLADHVRNKLSKNYPNVISVKEIAEAGEEKVLGLTIFEIYGVGGGSWSGSKSITAEAKLLQGGKVIGVFKDKNSSRGGALGGFKGTCAILDRAAEHLAEDMAKWLITSMQDKSSIDSSKPDK